MFPICCKGKMGKYSLIPLLRYLQLLGHHMSDFNITSMVRHRVVKNYGKVLCICPKCAHFLFSSQTFTYTHDNGNINKMHQGNTHLDI